MLCASKHERAADQQHDQADRQTEEESDFAFAAVSWSAMRKPVHAEISFIEAFNFMT